MKNSIYRKLSITAFALMIPVLAIVDWYWKGYGVLCMFATGTIGLVFDQYHRMVYPNEKYCSEQVYRTNKYLNIISMCLFVMSPMILIYGKCFAYFSEIWLFLIQIVIGIAIHEIAECKFNYKEKIK